MDRMELGRYFNDYRVLDLFSDSFRAGNFHVFDSGRAAFDYFHEKAVNGDANLAKNPTVFDFSGRDGCFSPRRRDCRTS